ncbi:hypothetical protein [Megasphaera elsdenii]|uniref:hypothetical protein n=1 Tax=Megasphaera elsdenii TaxID=907 RepID=UPI003522EB43
MSKAVNEKWKKTFPDTIGNQNRPAEGVDDTQPFETGAFPQYMANDPVRYDLQNAAMSQSMSNDARLKEMVDARGRELDDHKVDPDAHKTGIAGNAATATKVVANAAAGESANIAEASMASSDSARIRVSGANNAGELALETADNGNEAIVARQYTGAFKDVARTAAILDANGNTSFPGTVVAPKFTGALNGNAATASKLLTPRIISLSGKAAGSTSFDGSTNAAINVTSVNADTASKLSSARKINITGNATGAAAFDGSGDANISVTVNESKHAATADNSNKIGGYPLWPAEQGGRYGTVPFVKSDGVMEIGKYIDWHATNGGTEDYSSRWTAETNGTVSVGTINGTLKGNADSATTATKLQTARTISLTGNASGSTTFDGSADINISTTVNESKHAVNADSATKLATARAISLTGNASGSADFDGSGNISINTTVSMATAANSATKLANNGNRNDIANGARALSGLSVYQCYQNTGYPQQYGNVVSIGGTGDNELFLGWADDSRLLYRAKRDTESNWKSWRAIAFTDEINNYAPSKTGSGASGTWPISISGNADKLDGYHASDLFRHLGGNQTPVITDIFDRAGTIDMTTMSAADKATHKANINKARNASQNLWNTASGIRAYGGDYDINGYEHGTLKLTQSYKNFDKILAVFSNDDGNYITYNMWDVWELANAFANSYCFNFAGHGNIYWSLYGTTKHGTTTNYAVSTDTVWSCQDQNSGIVAIYGIKY